MNALKNKNGLLQLSFALLFMLGTFSCKGQVSIEQRAEQIKSQIVRPQFPNKRISIVEYGAKDDKNHDSSEAIKRAITILANEGGEQYLYRKELF